MTLRYWTSQKQQYSSSEPFLLVLLSNQWKMSTTSSSTSKSTSFHFGKHLQQHWLHYELYDKGNPLNTHTTVNTMNSGHDRSVSINVYTCVVNTYTYAVDPRDIVQIENCIHFVK